MKEKKHKTIFFDFDGTLADTIWIWESIDEKFLAQHGIEVPMDLKSKIEGMSFENTAVYFRENFGIKSSTEQIVAEWFEIARKPYEEEVEPVKGAVEILTGLRKDGYRIYLQTSNKSELVIPVLRKFSMDGFFDGMFFCQHKDLTETYLKVLEETNSKVNSSLLVDDAPTALEASKKAGITAVDVLICKSEKEKEEERKIGFIDFFVEETLEELARFLN
ncbi:HAD family phosphatase [candidate division WOR-3 bacterium]|nr:HAD family phosphatase [candidate division WOR-3 bacterium]